MMQIFHCLIVTVYQRVTIKLYFMNKQSRAVTGATFIFVSLIPWAVEASGIIKR